MVKRPGYLDLRLLLSIGLPLLVLLVIGQDVNWDLRNYHLYNPHAWWTGRYGLDIAPAQLQTWHNPFLDLPLYALDRLGASGFVVSLWLLLPAVVSVRLLLAISDRLTPIRPEPTHWILVAAIAVSGAGAIMEMGSSFNDWFVAAAVLAAIRLLLDDPRGTRILPGLLAGLCLGAMTGLKLAMGPYCIAMAVASFVAMRGGGEARRVRHLSLLAAGGVAGFVLTYGYWALFLHQQYANPFFPYFNQWFGSPWAPMNAWNDPRFLPAGLWEALGIPVQLLRPSTSHSEALIADPRLALGLLGCGLLAWRSGRLRGTPQHHAQRLVSVLIVVATLFWAAMFGIYRYLLPVEVLCSLMIVHGLLALQGSRALPVLALTVAAALAALTHVQDLERQPFAGSLSEIHAVLPFGDGDGDVVVTMTHEPVAFAATMFPEDVPLIGLANHFMRRQWCTDLQRRAEAVVQGRRGRLWLLDSHRGAGNESLGAYGLRVGGDCSEFASRYGMLYLCPLDATGMVRHCPGQ